MDRLCRVAGQAGYEALEIGYRRLCQIPVERMRDLLAANGLRLVASHIGGNLEDVAQADSERTMIDAVLDAVTALDAKYVMFSGLRYQDADQFAADLAMLNRCARKAADRGVRLLYHNHNWEFSGSPRAMDLLLEQRAPELGFCPDVGWVAKAGEDVMAFLKQVVDDMPLVHFKDFASLEPGVDTVCLGDGVVPLTEVAAWIQNGDNRVEWVIAEQDRADGPADEATTRNAQFLRRQFA
jgi:sugar phosphate isomerase/epimerase